MRLIDLDQTIFVPIVDESKGGVEYEMEMSIGEMFDKFLGGFQPEIVDAVPAEWIKNRLDAMLQGTASAGSCCAVMLLLADWQREQEASHRIEGIREGEVSYGFEDGLFSAYRTRQNLCASSRRPADYRAVVD